MNPQLEAEHHSPKFWLEFRTLRSFQPSQRIDDALQFNYFSRLPAELRLKIWLYLIEPRTILVCCLEKNGQLLQHHLQQLQQRSSHPEKEVPTILHVNQEAREVGLQHYEQTFSWRIPKLLSDRLVEGP